MNNGIFSFKCVFWKSPKCCIELRRRGCRFTVGVGALCSFSKAWWANHAAHQNTSCTKTFLQLTHLNSVETKKHFFVNFASHLGKMHKNAESKQYVVFTARAPKTLISVVACFSGFTINKVDWFFYCKKTKCNHSFPREKEEWNWHDVAKFVQYKKYMLTYCV